MPSAVFAATALFVFGFQIADIRSLVRQYRSLSRENRIRCKLTTNEVSDIFRPVLIYSHRGVHETATLAGVGTVFRDGEGMRAVTALHILGAHATDTAEKKTFIMRQLRPLEGMLESSPVHSISKMLPLPTLSSRSTAAEADLALCEVGRTAEPLTFPDEDLGKVSGGDATILPLSPWRQFFVTSLISGERVPVVGTVHRTENKTTWYLIPYESRVGDSGTGFVDDRKRLFVLVFAVRKKTAAAELFPFGLPPRVQLSVLSGPILVGQ